MKKFINQQKKDLNSLALNYKDPKMEFILRYYVTLWYMIIVNKYLLLRNEIENYRDSSIDIKYVYENDRTKFKHPTIKRLQNIISLPGSVGPNKLRSFGLKERLQQSSKQVNDNMVSLYRRSTTKVKTVGIIMNIVKKALLNMSPFKWQIGGILVVIILAMIFINNTSNIFGSIFTPSKAQLSEIVGKNKVELNRVTEINTELKTQLTELRLEYNKSLLLISKLEDDKENLGAVINEIKSRTVDKIAGIPKEFSDSEKTEAVSGIVIDSIWESYTTLVGMEVTSSVKQEYGDLASILNA